MIKSANALYMPIIEWGLLGSYEDVSSLWHGVWLCNTLHLGVGHSTCTGENSACITGLQKEINIKGHVKILSSSLNLLVDLSTIELSQTSYLYLKRVKEVGWF